MSFFSTDRADNAETARTAHVKIDKTAPSIGHSFTPLSDTDGTWTNEDVTVTFACADSGSGVASCTAPVTKTAEGASQQVVGSATDNAGNSATDTATVDKTPPTISATVGGTRNVAGWYPDDVSVTFSCADELSGTSICPTPKSLGEGADQSTSGTVTDAAGNSASDSVTGINIDQTPPTLTASFASGWHTGDVTVTWSCSDALSGPVAQPPNDTVTGEGADLSSSATCTDTAGNPATRTVSGIQIDRTAPTTTGSVPAPLVSGWYADAVQVTLDGHDGLSGSPAGSGRVRRRRRRVRHRRDVLPGRWWRDADLWLPVHRGPVHRQPHSGIAGCGPGSTLSNEGADQTALGDASDVAGNTAPPPSTRCAGLLLCYGGITCQP